MNAFLVGTWTTSAASCEMKLLAKDGVYIPAGPRALTETAGDVTIYASHLLVKCTGTVGTEAPLVDADSLAILTLEVVAATTSQAFADISFTPCLPAYLADTRSESVVEDQYRIKLKTAGMVINDETFSSFDQYATLHNMTVGTVEQWELNTGTHPLACPW